MSKLINILFIVALFSALAIAGMFSVSAGYIVVGALILAGVAPFIVGFIETLRSK